MIIDNLITKLRTLVKIDALGNGEFTLFHELLIDLKCASSFFNIETNLIVALEEIIKQKVGNGDLTKALNKDAIKVKDAKNQILDAFTCKANPIYTEIVIRKIRAIRGAVIYFHVIHNKNFSYSLARDLISIFKCRDIGFDQMQFFEKLNLDPENIKQEYELQSSYSKIFATLYGLINLDNKSIASPNNIASAVEIITSARQQKMPNKPEVNKEPLIEITSLSKEEQKKDEGKLNDDVPKYNDLLRYKLVNYSKNQRIASAVDNLSRFIHPLECVQYFLKLKIGRILNEIQLALLINLILGVTVPRFHFIDLKPSPEKNLWLDLDNGYLCYNRNFVIKKNKPPNQEDIILVPLPFEMIVILRSKYSKCGSKPETLADIFSTPINKLRKDVIDFCYLNKLTHHLVTPSKLEISFSRLVLSVCGDELYSALISVDYSITDQASMNYFCARASKVNEICSKTYSKLGLSGKLFRELNKDVGSTLVSRSDDAFSMIRLVLNNVNSAFDSLTNKTNLSKLIEIQEIVSKGMLTFCIFSSGLRNQESGFFANHQLDLSNGLLLITDKKTTEYNTWRVIPFSDLLQEWISFYYNFLHLLADRLANKNKNLSLKISGLANSKGVSEIPLFFKVDTQFNILPLASEDISQYFNDFNLPKNVGRHILDLLLRDTLGHDLTNSFMGRSESGQEAYGDRSLIPLQHAILETRNCLNSIFNHANIPLPKKIRTRTIKKNEIQDKHFRTDLATSRDDDTNQNDQQQCPFHEYSFLYCKYFKMVSEKWKSCVIDCDLADLVFSLIINDGVTFIDELSAAIHEIINGKIYKIGVKHAVDTRTRKVKLRRLYLSNETLLITHNLSCLTKQELLTINDIEIKIKNACNEKLKQFHEVNLMVNPNLKEFLETAKAHKSLKLSGVLREWINGNLIGRVKRIETVAREITGSAEVQSYDNEPNYTSRKLYTDKKIIDLLNYHSGYESTGSNKVRVKKFLNDLSNITHEFSLFEDQLLIRYVVFLATEKKGIKSVSTLKNHYFNTRNLIGELPFTFFQDELDVDVLINHINKKSIDKAKVTSYNYLLEMLKADFKLKTQLNRINPYAENFSDFDIKKIKNILETSYDASPMFKLQSIAMLELYSSCPIRSEDVMRIRVCDVFIGEYSHIHFTHQTTGTQKTKNANRVVFEEDTDWSYFKVLVENKRRTFPNNPKAYIFSENNEPCSLDFAESLVNKLCDAARIATGSYIARAYNFRQTVVSNKIKKACHPQTFMNFNFLKLRLFSYETSVSTGHGDEFTTIDFYANDFDVLRREWMNVLGREIEANYLHLSSLIKQNPDYVLKRLKNEKVNKIIQDKVKSCYTSMINIVPIEKFVSNVDNINTFEANENKEVFVISFAKYVIDIALKRDEVLARTNCNLKSEVFNELHNGLEKITSIKQQEFYICLKKFNFETVFSDKKFIEIYQHISPLNISDTELIELIHILPSDLSDSWICTDSQLKVIESLRLIWRLSDAGFSSAISMEKIVSKTEYEKIGFTCFYETKKNGLGKQKKYKISFCPSHSQDNLDSQIIKHGRSMAQISSILIAQISKKIGGKL